MDLEALGCAGLNPSYRGDEAFLVGFILGGKFSPRLSLGAFDELAVGRAFHHSAPAHQFVEFGLVLRGESRPLLEDEVFGVGLALEREGGVSHGEPAVYAGALLKGLPHGFKRLMRPSAFPFRGQGGLGKHLVAQGVNDLRLRFGETLAPHFRHSGPGRPHVLGRHPRIRIDVQGPLELAPPRLVGHLDELRCRQLDGEPVEHGVPRLPLGDADVLHHVVELGIMGFGSAGEVVAQPLGGDLNGSPRSDTLHPLPEVLFFKWLAHLVPAGAQLASGKAQGRALGDEVNGFRERHDVLAGSFRQQL